MITVMSSPSPERAWPLQSFEVGPARRGAKGRRRTMNQHTKSILAVGLGLVTVLGLTAPAVAQAADPSISVEHFTGNLVNLNAGARRSQPFSLTIEHYATQHDVDRFTGI